jgi:hypothetical protein
MSSHRIGERLATLPTFRDQITVRSAPLLERLGFTRRLEALQALFVNAPRKPTELHELQTVPPKRRLPDEIQHQMIHEGIRAGHITRGQIIAYRASQLIDDLSAFPGAHDADDATYCVLMQEVGEAVEAVTVDHGLQTDETRDRMRREVLEGAAVMLLHVETECQRRTA